MPIYEYRLFLKVQVQQLYLVREWQPDAYVADDSLTRPVKDVIADGFRWVRNEDDYAVFEREWSPQTQIKSAAEIVCDLDLKTLHDRGDALLKARGSGEIALPQLIEMSAIVEEAFKLGREHGEAK